MPAKKNASAKKNTSIQSDLNQVPIDLSISIIAPSFKIPQVDLDECLSALTSLNVNYSIEQPLFLDSELCAHTYNKRFSDFKKALSAKPEYIWCLRGGYGALQLVPELLKLKTPIKKPKTFKKLIGFSDITVLHYILNQKWNWPSLHWKHLNGFLIHDLKDNLNVKPSSNLMLDEKKKFNLKFFIDSVHRLNSEKYFYFNNLSPLNKNAEKTKSLKAKIVGGNLITMQSLVGQKIKSPKGKILFFEEIDEPVYKIDRALTQMDQAGWFKNIKGIVLGSFTNKNPQIELDTKNYFKTKFLRHKFPVFEGLKSGHIPDQEPLFLNTNSEINLDISQTKRISFILKNKNGFLD